MVESGVITPNGDGSKAALVYGQMNEPGAGAGVALAGLTLVFSRPEGQDVLFYEYFRLHKRVQVSALLGKIPSMLVINLL